MSSHLKDTSPLLQSMVAKDATDERYAGPPSPGGPIAAAVASGFRTLRWSLVIDFSRAMARFELVLFLKHRGFVGLKTDCH